MRTRSRLPIVAVLFVAVLFVAVVGAAMGGCTHQPRSSIVTLDVPGRVDATPWIAASGRFVAVAWGATADGKSDVFLAVSHDRGSTFRSPVQVNTIAGEARLGGEFPPRVALLSKQDDPVPEIAVLWTTRTPDATGIKVARSKDGGKTFSSPVTMQSDGAVGDRGWPAVAFDPHGEVHAVWLDHRDMAANRTGTGHTGHKAGAEHDGAAMAQKSSLYYASVATNRSPEQRLTRGVCYCCKTALATGPDGSLYAAWRHVYPGDLRDIAFTMSRDGGRSFSPPVRVREDGWAINGCPDDGPAIAVAADGVAHLAWPTVIGGQQPQGAIFYASTRDGSRFTPGVRVPALGGPKPSHPQILVGEDGRIFVAWDEGVDGRRLAAMREVQLQSDGTATFGEVVVLSPEGGRIPSWRPPTPASSRSGRPEAIRRR